MQAEKHPLAAPYPEGPRLRELEAMLDDFDAHFTHVAEIHSLDVLVSLPTDGEAPAWSHPGGGTGSPLFAALWSVCRCGARWSATPAELFYLTPNKWT